jgi:hypothetical protein
VQVCKRSYSPNPHNWGRGPRIWQCHQREANRSRLRVSGVCRHSDRGPGICPRSPRPPLPNSAYLAVCPSLYSSCIPVTEPCSHVQCPRVCPEASMLTCIGRSVCKSSFWLRGCRGTHSTFWRRLLPAADRYTCKATLPFQKRFSNKSPAAPLCMLLLEKVQVPVEVFRSGTVW